MNDHFLLFAGILAVLLVALQGIASLNASREINVVATQTISQPGNKQMN